MVSDNVLKILNDLLVDCYKDNEAKFCEVKEKVYYSRPKKINIANKSTPSLRMLCVNLIRRQLKESGFTEIEGKYVCKDPSSPDHFGPEEEHYPFG